MEKLVKCSHSTGPTIKIIIIVTYITQDLIGLACTDSIVLFRMACPLVQVCTVKHVTQDFLALLGNHMADHISRNVELSFGFIVGFAVVSLLDKLKEVLLMGF